MATKDDTGGAAGASAQTASAAKNARRRETAKKKREKAFVWAGQHVVLDPAPPGVLCYVDYCIQDPDTVTSRGHVTVAQWNHLLALIEYLYKNHDNHYALMMAINQFEIDDWEPLYFSLLDFKYKLRDVYMWWSQTVDTTTAVQNNNGSTTVPTSSRNSSDIGKMYAFTTTLRTEFFPHGQSAKDPSRKAFGHRGKMAPRGGTLFPDAFLDAIGRAEGDPERREEWFRRFNLHLSRKKQLQSPKHILVPPPILEALALPLCDKIWDEFCTTDAVYVMAAFHGSDFATRWNSDLLNTPEAKALDTWMWNQLKTAATTNASTGSTASNQNQQKLAMLREALTRSLRQIWMSVAAKRRKQLRRNQLKCHDAGFRTGVHMRVKRESN